MNDIYTINGHRMLLILRFVEKYVTRPMLVRLGVVPELPNIMHPFGVTAWLGQMAIRAPQRKTLEQMPAGKRHDAHFNIEIAADEIVAATSGPEVWGGLSDDDKDQLSELLVRFMQLVAGGEIPEHDLTR
ncbi:MAG: hypothetical protein WA001_05205 [Patescibacteria group bacterium]